MMRVIPSPLLTMNGAEMPLLSVCHPPRVRHCLPQKSTPGAGLRVTQTASAEGGVVIAVAYKDKAKKEEVDDDDQIKGKNNHKTPKMRI